jgi:hypothetical protein
VKAAAAVLGASLLFFFGVLTGLGRREAVAPPTAIPLGVEAPGSAAAGGNGSSGTRSPSPPRSPRSTAGTQATRPATPTTASTVTTSTTVPTSPGEPEPGETTTTTQPTATTITTAGEPTSTTTPPPARSGEVEQVDGEVDCTSAGGRNRGKRQPCASTTTSSRDGSGDRRNR